MSLEKATDWESDYEVRCGDMEKVCRPPRSDMTSDDFEELIAILRRTPIEAPERWGLWLKEKPQKRDQSLSQP